MNVSNKTTARLRKAAGRLGKFLAPEEPGSGGLRILMYHRVADIPGDRLAVSPDRFARQMDLLLESGRPVGMLEELFAAGDDNRGPVLALTFDDGYQDIYDNVYPVLKTRGLPATVFVVPEFIEGRIELPRYRGRGVLSRPLSWDMLAELNAGGMVVGSHSLTHRELTGLARAEARREIIRSREIIGNRLGSLPDWFAYPRGKVDSTLAGLVQAAGYRGAVTVRPGINRLPFDRYLLRRTEISGVDDREDFLLKIQGGFDLPHRLWQAAAGKRL